VSIRTNADGIPATIVFIASSESAGADTIQLIVALQKSESVTPLCARVAMFPSASYVYVTVPVAAGQVRSWFPVVDCVAPGRLRFPPASYPRLSRVVSGVRVVQLYVATQNRIGGNRAPH